MVLPGVPARLYVLTHGGKRLLEQPALGLLCSVQCPGSVILKLYDAIRELRDAGVTVLGGFHSPMERECLDLLLRGTQPVIVATPRPRKLNPLAWKTAIVEGRLAVVAPRESTARRTTAALATQRNQLVAELASVLFVPYASPGGKTEALALATMGRGKKVVTLDDPANEGLLAAGAAALSTADVLAMLGMSAK